MLRRLIRFCVLSLYTIGSLWILVVLFGISARTTSPQVASLVIIELLGFMIGLSELYLLHRNHTTQFPVSNNQSAHAFVFIGEESLETIRISLLSLSHLRGTPKVTVICSKDRFEVESLCSELNFEFLSKIEKFDNDCDQLLFTNGHTIVYPDAILVGQRRLGENISFVELNHSIYSSHALGNNIVGHDASRASLLSSAAGSYSVPIYTGGPILIQRSKCDFEHLFAEQSQMQTFSFAIASVVSGSHSGTITSHPCCECMSHNEIDHNISSRTARIKVSRRLRTHPQYIDTAKGIIRRYIGWYYMRFFWLKSISYLAASIFIVGSLLFPLPNDLLSLKLFVLLVVAQCSSFLLSYFQGDRRLPIERLRDSVLDCEAFIHAVAIKFKANSLLSHYKIRFIPFYICIALAAMAYRFSSEPLKHSIHDTDFWNSFLALAGSGLIVIVLYRAMNRYLSARQRAFARRNVSITGSSSYESMWIVDLTHRGAAYLSDTQFEIGEETPLVFRVPTMDGDSLITVIGKVTYCGRRGSQYQVGVAFKELSQSALDDLTIYCSVIYPYRQARNIDDSENLTETFSQSNQGHDPRRNVLSVAIFSFACLVVAGMMIALIPVAGSNPFKSNLNTSGDASKNQSLIRNEYAINEQQYDLASLAQSSNLSDSVTISSSIYLDSNNDGIHNKSEAGLGGITVRLFGVDNVEIKVGADGVLGTVDDQNSELVTNQNGDFSFRLIKSGSYYVSVENISSDLMLSDSSIEKVGIVPSRAGYRSKIFTADSNNNGNISDLNLGLVLRYDLGVSQEFVGISGQGAVPGDIIKIRVTATNSGPATVLSGFVVNSVLGADYDQDNIEMLNTSGFSPCGFSGLKLECVGTSALAPGESRSIEFSTTSHVSPSSTSSRRQISSLVKPSRLDHIEANAIEAVSNNRTEMVLPVGQSTSIGDRVFFDANSNGIQDSGEKGVEGIRVGLLQFKDVNGDGVKDPGETPEISHDVTDSNGYFGVSSGKAGFQNLTAGSQYSLSFSKIPKEMNITKINVSQNPTEFDSDVDPVTKTTGWFTLEKGVVNTSVDLGLAPKLRNISNAVFIDSNGDGKLNKSETGLESLEIRLYEWVDVNSDQRKDKSEVSKLPVAITVTNNDGSFSFNGVRDSYFDTYYFVETDLPSGYKVRKSDQNKDKEETRIRSNAFTSNEFNASDLMALQENGSSVEGSFWADISVDSIVNSNEHGVSGIKVYLVKESGKVVSSSSTKRDGEYKFNNVSSGEYFLGFKRNSMPKGFRIAGIENGGSAKGISVLKKFPIEVQTNSPVSLRPLAVIPDTQIQGIFKNSEKTSNIEGSAARVKVTIMNGQDIVFETSTKKSSEFLLSGLIPGAYEVRIDEGGKISEINLQVVPGSTVFQLNASSGDSSEFVSNLLHGKISDVSLSNHQSSELRSLLLFGAIFSGAIALLTLIRRRKLVYRNS